MSNKKDNTKKRTTVSVDPEVLEWFREQDMAFSPIVNKMAEEFKHEGKTPDMARMQAEILHERVDELEDEFDNKMRDLEQEMQQAFDAYRDAIDEALGDAPDVGDDGDAELEAEIDTIYDSVTHRQTTSSGLVTEDNSIRDPENGAITNHAQRLGIAPDELVRRLEIRDYERGFRDHDPRSTTPQSESA